MQAQVQIQMEKLRAAAAQTAERVQEGLSAAYAQAVDAWGTHSERATAVLEEYFPGRGDLLLRVGVALVAVLVVVLLGLLVRVCATRRKRRPVVLLLGISGAGKTSVLASLVHGEACDTHTSQEATVVEDVALRKRGATAGAADATVTVVDTPGHPRLRHEWHRFVGAHGSPP